MLARIYSIALANVLGLLAMVADPREARAVTFAEAVKNRINEVSNLGIACAPFTNNKLQDFCNQGGATVQPGNGSGSQTQSNTRDIFLQQMRKIRIADGKGQIAGASPDGWEKDWGNGFGAFVLAGAKGVRHRANPYEDGFDSAMPSVSFGGDYRFLDNWIAGLAFNYFNWSGEFNSGGNFTVDSYGFSLYSSYAPFEGFFVDASMGYSYQDNLRNRQSLFTKRNGNLIPKISGAPKGEFNSHYLHGNIQSGYDFRLNDLRIGPRLGLSAQGWLVDKYSEKGISGLELSYRSGLDQYSVQSSLGLQTTYDIPTSFGRVTPFVQANWVHEFANDQRSIKASFVYDSTGTQFAFQTETPASDWALFEVGMSVASYKNVSGIVSFSTVQGNRRIEAYGGNIGVRYAW